MPDEKTPESKRGKKPGFFQRFFLTRAQRLRGKALIDDIYRRGQRRHHHPLTACLAKRDDRAANRLAISITRRCGPAVTRNAIRRRIREAYRLMQHDLTPGVDILLIVRMHKTMKVEEYKELLRKLL